MQLYLPKSRCKVSAALGSLLALPLPSHEKTRFEIAHVSVVAGSVGVSECLLCIILVRSEVLLGEGDRVRCA